MRRCLKLPRCSGDAVHPVGVTTPRGLLLVSASLGFDGWEYLSQVPDGFRRRGNSGCTRLVVVAGAAHSAGSHDRAGHAARCPPSARPRRWRGSSTATHGDLADTNFEITHPHHPLRGQKFKLITYRHNWGEDRVYFHNADGCLSSIPAGWTTVVAPDPFVAVAGGRCFFRYQDLLQLVDLMEKLR